MPGMSVLNAFYTAADESAKKTFHRKIAMDIVFQRKKNRTQIEHRMKEL
jgi:hypothetical protein